MRESYEIDATCNNCEENDTYDVSEGTIIPSTRIDDSLYNSEGDERLYDKKGLVEKLLKHSNIESVTIRCDNCKVKGALVKVIDEYNDHGFRISPDVYEMYQECKKNRFMKQSIEQKHKDKPLHKKEMNTPKEDLDKKLETKTGLQLKGAPLNFGSGKLINLDIALKEEILKTKEDLEDAKYLRTVFKEANEETINVYRKMLRNAY